MATDLKDAKQFLEHAVEGAGEHLSDLSPDGDGIARPAGILAGVGAAAVLPVVLKAAAKRVGMEDLTDHLDSPGEMLDDAKSKLGDKVGSGLEDKLSEKVGNAGGLPGALGKLFTSGGGDDDDEDQKNEGPPGTGKGRRMPVQQSVDIGAPLQRVYNHFTQFEEWPNFMHRVTRVSQEDKCTVSFAAKIWGKTKEFKATIETQRPDERIKWKVSEGMTHTGVVSFHELGPDLTRVLLNLDVQPDGMVDKFARGARLVKRAARGDLHRFKAYVEMNEEDTDGWRGVIEDGKVKRSRGSSNGSGRSRQSGGRSSSGGGSRQSSSGQSSRRRQSH